MSKVKKVKNIKKIENLFLVFTFLLVLSCPTFAAEILPKTYDVVVIGAGSSGCAAAISAARMGAGVALVEEYGMVGGQMTAAAVSTMDDQWRTRYGIYWEFIGRVQKFYGQTSISTGLWADDTLCFEPVAGEKILLEMLNEAGVDLFLNMRPIEALKDGDSVIGAVFLSELIKPVQINGKIFIDATECGDFIPLSGARYRAGNSIAPNINYDAKIQDITQVAVIKKYDFLPKELLMTEQPVSYDEIVGKFKKIIAVNALKPGKGAPYDVPTHNAYRGLPDKENKNLVQSGNYDTWKNITKTGINWANDYPGDGLSVKYLEDRIFRKETDRLAILRTLQFLYYFQNELGQRNWSVDEAQNFYRGYNSAMWEVTNFADDYKAILMNFPPIPYVRESRRIVGLHTLTYRDIIRDKSKGKALVNFPTSLALGEYQVDLHSSKEDEFLEHDLGEYAHLFPKGWVGSEGVYQVPYEVFIPEKIDNLIAAEKNISVSRMVNGTIRLQPVTMHTGQAAGAIAAVSAFKNIFPRDVCVFEVQLELLKKGAQLAMENYADADKSSPYWKEVQLASLYKWIEPLSPKIFGVNFPLSYEEARELVQKSLNKTDENLSRQLTSLTRGEALKKIIELGERIF